MNCLGYKDIVQVSDLEIGDIVRGKTTGQAFVVSAKFGDLVTAVCVADITNPKEWQVMGVHLAEVLKSNIPVERP